MLQHLKKKLHKYKAGNIILVLLVVMLISSTMLSVYVSYARDKRNTNISAQRMQEKIDMNAYNVAAQMSIFDYFNNYEIPMTFTQMISGEGEEQVIHRISVTNPFIIDINDSSPITINNTEMLLFDEGENNTFAGYRYTIKLAMDIKPSSADTSLRVENFAKNISADFWEDNNLTLKSEGAYSLWLKDIPITVVLEYKSWRQQTNYVIKNARFEREPFFIIKDSEDGNAVGGDDLSNLEYSDTVRGFIRLDNAYIETVESVRTRK